MNRAYRYLIPVFLLLTPILAEAETYTISFGAIGGVVVQYEVTTTQKFSPYFQNVVSGTLTNMTKVPIHCLSVAPIVVGETPPSLLSIIGVRLGAGESQPFKKDDIHSRTNISATGISEWKVTSCTTPLTYEFVNKSATKKFPFGMVTGTIGDTQIGIVVENTSSQPIEIVWNDSSFVDIDRSAKRIFHVGVKYTDREQSLPNTTIPPLAKVEDAATPTANVSFVGGRYGGWSLSPLLRGTAPPENADKVMAGMKGAKVALFLQLLVGGRKTPVTLVFEVSVVTPQKLTATSRPEQLQPKSTEAASRATPPQKRAPGSDTAPEVELLAGPSLREGGPGEDVGQRERDGSQAPAARP